MTAVIHINGYPGTGKLSVARALAPLIGGRVIDNHTLINPAAALFERRQREFGQLRGEIRRAVMAHAAEALVHAPLIFTDALSDDDWDMQTFEDYRLLARKAQVPIIAVVLECDADENERRLTLPGRTEQSKLTDGAVLGSLRANHPLLHGLDEDTLVVDNTSLSPDATANQIAVALRQLQH